MKAISRLMHYSTALPLLLAGSPASAHGFDKWDWKDGLPDPEPEVTYLPEDSVPGVPIAPSGEVYLPPTDERLLLHADSHDYTPIVTATLPPLFDPPAMDTLDDFVMQKEELVVVNPAPDEFLWIMEGQRHGFENLTIVLTDTQTGNGAPLHTHVGEEAHVLLHGKMRYFLDGEEFTVEAPYIINIPSMVPHAFMNIDEDPAELVGVFPDSSHWEYDVLDADVFADVDVEVPHRKRGRKAVHGYPDADSERVAAWYSEHNRKRRMEAFRQRELHDPWSTEPLQRRHRYKPQ